MAAAMMKHVDGPVPQENSPTFNVNVERQETAPENNAPKPPSNEKGKKLANDASRAKKSSGNSKPPSSSSSKTNASVTASAAATQGQGPSHNIPPPGGRAASQPHVNTFNKETLLILREMNGNISKTNEKVESLAKRVDDLYECDDSGYYYDDNEDDDAYSENDDDENDSYQNPPPLYQSQDNGQGMASGNGSLFSPDCDTQANDNIFNKFCKSLKKADQVSPSVDDKLAQVVNDAFREGMGDDTYNSMIKMIHRPDNCGSLVETRVNPGVWSVLRQHTQMEDSRLTGIQNCVVKAAVNIVKLLNSNQSMDESSLELGMNALALLGQGNKWLNARRKDYHKRDMDLRLHHLCSASTSYTDMLYGDSIVKDIRDIQEMNKISRNVASTQNGRGYRRRGRGRFFSRSMRYRPYGRGRRGSRSRGQSKNGQMGVDKM